MSVGVGRRCVAKLNIDTLRLKQLVNVSTHSKGHILDVVIVRDNTCIVPALPNIYGYHVVVSVCVNARNPYGVRKSTTFRILRQINVSDFMQILHLLVDRNVGAMVEAYDTGLRRIVDHHAPLVVKTVWLKPNSPWYTDELRREKHNRRRAEQKRLRMGLVVDMQGHRMQCMVVNHILVAKRNYYLTRSRVVGVTKSSSLICVTHNESKLSRTTAVMCVSKWSGPTVQQPFQEESEWQNSP